MQADINEVWKRFSELNDLKNSLFERNEDLRVEVDSFKTHFSKYEPEDFKQRGGGTFDTFQTALYSELTNLRAERDMLLWQLRKQACIMYAQRSKIEGLAEMVPQMEKELRSAEDREKALVIECGNIKEQAVHNMQGAEFEKVKVLIQMYEGVRYKRDRVQLVYENSRLRRENESLRKES
jgi:regulator of replication initiation timing